MQLNILTFSLTSKRLTYLILFSGLWFTFYITLHRDDSCAMESQTGAQRLNKIIHFVPFEPGTTDRSKPAEFISTVRGSKI